MIPLSIPNIGARERELVVDCLDRGWISSAGSYVGGFEDAVAQAVGGRGAAALSSGTTALNLALRLAGVQPGDEVIVPALTFIAPANAVRHRGAWPVFVDVDRDHWQMDPAAVRRFLEEECEGSGDEVHNLATGRRVRALVPVHILGHPAPVTELEALASEWGLTVVEDAAEALGARYADGTPVGGRGRYVCFSFNGNKIVSTGGGGMLVSDDPEVAARARFLSAQAKSDPDEYIHSTVGYNYRLTNLQAALGVAQMERLPEFVRRKGEVAARYRAALADIPGLELMEPADGVTCTWWLVTVLLPAGVDRRAVGAALRSSGIEVRPLWQPLHLSPAMRGAHAAACPVAETLYERALSLPSSTSITHDEVDTVIDVLRRALRNT